MTDERERHGLAEAGPSIIGAAGGIQFSGGRHGGASNQPQPHATVTPTDGDAERQGALAQFNYLMKMIEDAQDVGLNDSQRYEVFLRAVQLSKNGVSKTIRTALQTHTPPVPVDTINIKREVLMGVRAAFKGLSNMYTYAFDLSDGGLIMMGSHVQKFEDTHRVAQEALASLDAVLSEGES